MRFSLVFCFIFLIIQVESIYGQYTVNHEIANSIHSTFEMYRKLYDENTNFVFSPLSFRILYSILYQPSSGVCKRELKNLLFDTRQRVPQKSDLVNAQTQNFADILTSPKIKLANKIYLANNLQLKPDFTSLVGQYRTAIEQVDFQHGGQENIANDMNHWVERQTNGLIKNLVEPSSVTPDVQLFLINTVYFKADWLVPFSKMSVRPQTFTSIDGTENSIDAIHDTDYFRISFNDELNVDVLELRYTRGSGFAFWLILPRKNFSLRELKDNLNVDFVTKIKNSIDYHYARIQFPVFEIESTIDGKDVTPNIFGRSDFHIIESNSRMRNNTSQVDEIKQKAKIIVNTQGTEAAAVSYGKVMPLSLPMARPTPRLFKANRPFMYALVSDATKEPIFIGHFSKA